MANAKVDQEHYLKMVKSSFINIRYVASSPEESEENKASKLKGPLDRAMGIANSALDKGEIEAYQYYVEKAQPYRNFVERNR